MLQGSNPMQRYRGSNVGTNLKVTNPMTFFDSKKIYIYEWDTNKGRRRTYNII